MLCNSVDCLHKSHKLTHAKLALALDCKSVSTYYFHRSHLGEALLTKIREVFSVDLTEHVHKFLEERRTHLIYMIDTSSDKEEVRS